MPLSLRRFVGDLLDPLVKQFRFMEYCIFDNYPIRCSTPFDKRYYLGMISSSEQHLEPHVDCREATVSLLERPCMAIIGIWLFTPS